MYNINNFFEIYSISILIFGIGITGIFLNRKNIIIIIMSIEIMLLGINLFFIYISILYNNYISQIFIIFILTIAGAESAIGLALLIILYKIRGTIAIEYLNLMKG